MPDYKQSVFISYAWGEETHEREAIVNQLDQSLQKRGLKIIRDKRDLGYKGRIREFMSRIGDGDCIIIVISDKYLKSKNCMFELVEIAANKDFIERIFPIVLSDAKIYEALDRIAYKKYWNQKKNELNQEMLTLGDLSNITGISEELNDYDRFGDEFDKLTTTLKNMNTLSPDILRESDFQQLYDALVERMSTTWAKSQDTDQQSKPVTKKERKIMDPITLATAATSLLAPFLLPETVGKIWNTISKKSESITDAASDLTKNPDDADNEVFLKKQLQKALEKDQEFASLLNDLVEQAKSEAGRDTVGGDKITASANENSTAVGKISIGGNVSGNFTIGNNNQINSK
jgi:hypothetical protein